MSTQAIPTSKAPAEPMPKAKKSRDLKTKFEVLTSSDWWPFLKWSIMAVCLIWLLVFRLSESAEKLPEFVYVNF